MTLLLARRALLVARFGGDPGTGAARPRPGGLAPARPDQRYAPPFPAAVPPGRGNVVRARQVIISGPNEGLFEYIGNPALGNSPILWATAPGTATDPAGNPLEVSGGLAVARRASNVIQQLIWLDPTTGSLFLGAGPRTSTYRMAAVDVANALPFELDLISAFDTISAPISVGVRMKSGTSGGQFLIAAPAGANPIGAALAELGVGGSGVSQTLALGIGIPITDTVYQWVIDEHGKMQWGPGGAGALDTTLYRAGVGLLETSSVFRLNEAAAGNTAAAFFVAGDTVYRLQITADGGHQWSSGAAAADLTLARAGVGSAQFSGATPANTYLLVVAPTTTGVGGLGAVMGAAADFALAARVTGDLAQDPRWLVTAGGNHQWGPGGSTAVDTTLKRIAAGVLELDNQLNISQAFNVATLTASHFGVDSTGKLYFNTAASIGSNLIPTASSPNIVTAAGGQGAGVSGYPEISPAADFTNFTVTAAAATQCTKAWSIPAADAQVGTTYRLTFFGNGTQGSTVQSLTFQLSLLLGGVALPSSFGGVSGAFNWKVVIELTVKTTGAGGTCNVVTTASAGQGGTGDHTVTGVSSGSAFNTTIANTFEGNANWGSVTGAPTLTCIQSRFERLGP